MATVGHTTKRTDLWVILVLVHHPLVHGGVDGHLGLRFGRLGDVAAPAAPVDRRHQRLELVGVNDELLELVRPVGARVVHGSLQVLELVRVDHESLEVVVPVGVVDRALQGSGGCTDII